MAYDPSFGSGLNTNSSKVNNKNSMSGSEQNLDFGDLYQNEESIDLASYMTPQNLDLCDDDLFQSLFPSEVNIKKEQTDPLDLEVEWFSQEYNVQSACSSAAPSPTAQFYTPPVTSKSELPNTQSAFLNPNILSNQRLTQQLQLNSLSNNSMSQTSYTPITGDDTPKKIVIVPKPQTNMKIKSEPVEFDYNNNQSTTTVTIMPEGRTYLSATKRNFSEDSTESESGPKKQKFPPKNTKEYQIKRERNNVAVRKSRDKAKLKAVETAVKVTELTNENKRLRDKVNELTHELNTLRGILQALPPETTGT